MIPHDDNPNATPLDGENVERVEAWLRDSLPVEGGGMPERFEDLFARTGREASSELSTQLTNALAPVPAPASLDRRVEAETGLILTSPVPIPFSRRLRIVVAGVAAAILCAIAIQQSAKPAAPSEGPRLVLQRVDQPLSSHGLGATSLFRAGQAGRSR